MIHWCWIISDIQRGSAQSFEPAHGSWGNAGHVAELKGEKTPPQFSDDVLGDILTEPVSLGDLVLENDSFGLDLTLPEGGKKKNLNEDPFEDIVDEPAGLGSELMLTLDKHRIEVVEDLDSIFDSTMVDEPTLARNEMAGARPSGAESLRSCHRTGRKRPDRV